MWRRSKQAAAEAELAAAEEVERILLNEGSMEERVFLDPTTMAITTRMVPAGSPVQPYEQLRAETFNRLERRIAALEQALKELRTRGKFRG